MLASDTYAVSGTFHNDNCDIPHSSAQIVLGTVNWGNVGRWPAVVTFVIFKFKH